MLVCDARKLLMQSSTIIPVVARPHPIVVISVDAVRD